MNDVAESLQRSLRTLRWTTVLLAAALVAIFAWGWISYNRSADKAERANTALCALRGDLEQRVKDSLDFLAKHPNGIAGIPAETFQANIINQQRTITALQILKCGG